MILITYLSMIILFISTAMIIMNLIISKKNFSDREKSSPFECGFDPKNKARTPFSMHFFLIAVIFLVFDVEITLLMPMVYTMKISNLLTYSLIFFYFILILIFGVYHEWKQGALNWTN